MLRDREYLLDILDILQAAEFAVLGPMAAKHPVLQSPYRSRTLVSGRIQVPKGTRSQ